MRLRKAELAARRGDMPHAVVIGLDSLPGIQAARILARRGVPVIAVAKRDDHYCCRTNVCERIIIGETQGPELIPLLQRIGAELGERAVLVPCTDISVHLISRYRADLEPCFGLALPAHQTVETLMDKARFCAYATAQGLPVPATRILHSREDAVAAADTLHCPCILKPALKTATWAANSPKKAYLAESPAELLTHYDRCAKWEDTLIVQEWVPGPDANLFSCNCYFDRQGRCAAAFVARKIRQWPPGIGISASGVACRNDLVRDTAVRLFGSIGYRGLGYIEMKCHAKTGAYFLLEANVGRPTVRSAIAEAGGVDMLYALYCDCLDLPLPVGLEQRDTGVKWLHLHYDFRSAWYYWRRGELSLVAWAESWRGPKWHALWSWDDPLPFLADVTAAALRGARRVCRGG
jgi:predicted ATP-grasp superfamily ATP-dependent carboligase